MVRGSYPIGTSVKCVVHPFFGKKRGSSRRRKRRSALNFTCDGVY